MGFHAFTPGSTSCVYGKKISNEVLLNKLIIQIRVACIRKCHKCFHVHHSKFKQVRRKELKWAWKWQGVKTENHMVKIYDHWFMFSIKPFTQEIWNWCQRIYTVWETCFGYRSKVLLLTLSDAFISLHMQALAYVGCCFSLLREGIVRIYTPAYQASRSYPCGCLIPL